MNVSAKAGHGQLTLYPQGKNRITHIFSLYLSFCVCLSFFHSNKYTTKKKKKSLSRYIQVCKHRCQDPQTSLLCCSQVCLGPEEDGYSKTAAALVTVESQAAQRAKNRAKRKKGQTKTNAELLDGQRNNNPPASEALTDGNVQEAAQFNVSPNKCNIFFPNMT